MNSPLQPLNDMVLMKPVEHPERIGLIWVPECAKGQITQGDVIAVGPGRRDKKGRLQPTEVKPGDRVQLRHTFNTIIEIRGQLLMMAPESELVGVIEVHSAKNQAT